jgi:polysaccharide export outer membrane protein
VGDVVQVTIYETGGALFGSPAPQPGAATLGNQIPSQTVDESGAISVPYAGRISVKGRSPSAIETEIVEKLKGKAINPQVIVAVGDRRGGNLVTVTGDVKTPMAVPMGFAGIRVLDAVTVSGGSAGRPRETVVSVIRGSLVRSDSLADILNNPSKNVALQPGDTVVVKNTPRTFLVFGAVGSNARLSFDGDQVSLADAMARSGGLSDGRSNPAAIFVYRMEPKSLVKKLGHKPKAVVGDGASVIYNLDLVSPKGFFLAQNFEVQDRDIIYIADAGSVGLAKFFGLVNTITSGARTEATSAATLTR